MSDEAWTDEDLGQLAADIHGAIEYAHGDELERLKDYGRAERKRALEDVVAEFQKHGQVNEAFAGVVRALIDEEEPVARRKADGGETA